jgi:hypothetical protein
MSRATPRPDLAPGGAFPDLALTDHAGNARSLGELVAGDPAVLHFYRGWWCPFLCDPEREALDLLGLRETTDTVNHPYVPAVFTLAPDLRIHAAYDGYWYWGRPTGEELRGDLRAISRAVRPDWDAPTP